MQAREAISQPSLPARSPRAIGRRGIARTGVLVADGALGLLLAGLGIVLFADLTPCAPTGVDLRVASVAPLHTRGWIGVMVENSPSSEGYVRIRRVDPGMPAWRAGLLSGDLI